MNNNQRFDESIKEQFSNYAPDVHPRIWENIVSKREKRKPAGFWLTFFNSRNILVILGILIAGGSGAWLLIKNSSSLPANTKNNEPALIEKDRSLNNARTVTTEINNTSNADNSTAATPATVLNNKNNTLSTSPALNAPVINSRPTANIRTYTQTDQNIHYGAPSFTNKKRTLGIGPFINNDKGDLSSDNLSLGGTLLGRLTYEAQKITARVNTNTVLQKRGTPFWSLPDCPALENDAAGNKKYFEIYFSPDLALRKLSDTGNSVYLQKRKESSKFSSAYSAGILYTRVFGNSMSVRTGINYSQINEKFTFVQGNLVQITYIIDANGDTTGSYITRGTRYKTTHNKYHSIDVPLLVGYEVGNGRVHANISAGPVVNIYSWQKGEVLDTAYQPVNITTGKGSSPYQFKTNAGVGFMTSASIYYKLNDKIHLMAEPYFRYNFTQMNNDNLTLKQKYSTVGLRLGLRLDLK